MNAQENFDQRLKELREKALIRRAQRAASGRFPALKLVDGKVVCRGCGGAVPPKRKTWCSKECVRKFDPFWVKKAVDARDGHKCQFCGVLTTTSRDQHNHQRIRWSLGNNTNPDWEARRKELIATRREYDHVVPFCEGGPTTLENMRTLCHACHTKRTAAWRKDRKASK